MGFHAQVKVRFSDVDNAGIVYYPRFFHFFHVAFEEMFSTKFGIHYVDVINVEKLGFPAVHAESDFKAPLRYGDIADVEISLERLGAKSITFAYRLTRQPANELCATGKVTVAMIAMEGFRAIPVPEKYQKLFRSI